MTEVILAEKDLLKTRCKNYEEAFIIIKDKINNEIINEQKSDNTRILLGLRKALEIVNENQPKYPLVK